ncbi:MAG: sodium ion-translocating decarboxylase subunit beta [Verrucomicrobiia bacterium]
MLTELTHFIEGTGLGLITWQMVVMWGVVLGLLYLAVRKGFEPLLLVPIAFGALLANLPTRGVITEVVQPSGVVDTGFFNVTATPVEGMSDEDKVHLRVDKMEGGLFDFISQGIKLEIFPPIIFLGVGALTDFGPLIANPRTLLLGAAAQFGILFTFFGATLLGFGAMQAASIAIIGGADGPTSIFVTNKLAPELLGPVAVAAYTYMALVPMIQPPIMRLLTTKKERAIRMKSLRTVGRTERLTFCLLVTFTCILLVPDAAALIGMLMLGNFLRECGVTERLVKAAQNEIINIVTIFLGVSVGITMKGEGFLQLETLKIIGLGVVAFGIATGSGVVVAKVMNWLSPGNPINPLIGSAGVSAVPMAARVSHLEGQRADPNNYLLMHAMGPNVAGVIGTAIAAGYFISALGN